MHMFFKCVQVLILLLCINVGQVALAASLQFSPSTGVYTTGSSYTVRVVVNTDGKPINAAEGTIKFNPKEVTVVSVDRSASIFNLWVAEPTFSNLAGTITFSGGLPSGYTGAAGTVFSVTFRSIGSGPAKVSFTGGAVLANDGQGTNVLSAMNGGSYTIQAVSTDSVPEIIEYIAPANTPGVPKIMSATHPDPTAWYSKVEAVMGWELPSGIIAVRTALDGSPTTVPTKVYDNPIKTITLSDLEEGTVYFHLQFKNSEGWGKVAHYRLATDTSAPSTFSVDLKENSDLSSPIQTLTLSIDVKKEISPVKRFMVKIDDRELYEYLDEEAPQELVLPALEPGYHAIIIEAFDQAGNSSVDTESFIIEAFAKPVFTDYPNELNEEVIPVIKGMSRPGAKLEIILEKIGGEPTTYTVTANEAGVFNFIPEGTLSLGVYELSALATDVHGAKSERSEVVRIAVQKPGYILFGEKVISFLTIAISLVSLVVVLFLSFWFTVMYLRRLRRKVFTESTEAHVILTREFNRLEAIIATQKTNVTEAKKTKKLNSAEEDAFVQLEEGVRSARIYIEKEVLDVEHLVDNK